MVANEQFEKREGHWYNRVHMVKWAVLHGVTLKKLPSIYWGRLHFGGETGLMGNCVYCWKWDAPVQTNKDSQFYLKHICVKCEEQVSKAVYE